MLDRAIIYRRKIRFLDFIYVFALLVSACSMALAEIPLPRSRPADIPGDQSHQSPTTQSSQCQQQLAGLAEFKPMPPITGPGECVANDIVALELVLLPDGHRVVLSPSSVLRCSMAETVTHWVRDDVAPIIATLGTSLRSVETLDSFVCRGRNGASGGKISEHGRANALDVRALKLADGRTIGLTDIQMSKPVRENLRQSACVRFTTVLGNGADAYHDSHVHLDLIERRNDYRICQWDVLDPAETAAFAAKKALAAANAGSTVSSDVPLPRPRPVFKPQISTLSQHRQQHFQEAGRGSIFDYFAPLKKQRR
jgi:Extensin-like protein C-terminus